MESARQPVVKPTHFVRYHALPPPFSLLRGAELKPRSEALGNPPELLAPGYDEQGAAGDAGLAVEGLEEEVDPDLPVALAALGGVELVVAEGAGADDVEGAGGGGPAVLQVEAGREHALAAGAERGLLEGGARAVLVEDGGERAAVHHRGEARDAGAQVDDVDDLGARVWWGGGERGEGGPGRAVVEDVLVGAYAGGAAEGPRGEVVRARVERDRAVGFVVRPCDAVGER